MKQIFFAVGILVLAVSLSGCLGSQTPVADSTMQNNLDATSNQVELEESSALVTSTKSVTLEAGNYEYSQESFDAQPGETVELTLRVTDGMHDLKIDELNVRTKVLREGQSEVVTFTIPADAEEGTTYEYYCSVSNHKALGMSGRLVVRSK